MNSRHSRTASGVQARRSSMLPCAKDCNGKDAPATATATAPAKRAERMHCPHGCSAIQMRQSSRRLHGREHRQANCAAVWRGSDTRAATFAGKRRRKKPNRRNTPQRPPRDPFPRKGFSVRRQFLCARLQFSVEGFLRSLHQCCHTLRKTASIFRAKAGPSHNLDAAMRGRKEWRSSSRRSPFRASVSAIPTYSSTELATNSVRPIC